MAREARQPGSRRRRREGETCLVRKPSSSSSYSSYEQEDLGDEGGFRGSRYGADLDRGLSTVSIRWGCPLH